MWKKNFRFLLIYFVVQPLQADTWNVNTSGTWETASNWITAIVPNSPTSAVTFGNAITSDTTISIGTSNQVQSLTFDSAFSYTLASTGGSLTVGDTITFTSGSHTIGTDITFGPTMTINQNSTQNSFFQGNLTGTNLVIQGADDLISSVFNGFVNMSGNITIESSTVTLTAGSSISAAPISLSNRSRLIIEQDMTLVNDISYQGTPNRIELSGNTVSLSGNISSPGAVFELVLLGPGTLNIAGANTATGFVQVFGGAIVLIDDDNAFGTAQVELNSDSVLTSNTTRTLANSIRVGNTGILRAAAGTELIFNGNISGTAVVFDGPGTKVVNSATLDTFLPSFTGGLTQLSAATNFSAFASIISIDNAFVEMLGDRTINADISITGDSGLTPNAGTTLTLSGVISGEGNLTLNGEGTTIVTQANTSTGTTTLSSGITIAGNDNAFGSNNISLNGGTLNNTSSDRTLDNTISLDSDSVVNATAATTFTLNGVISGASNIDFTGAGTTALTGVNTYTGNTSIASGIVSLPTNNTNAAFGTGNLSFDGGTLRIPLNATINNDIILNTTATISGTGSGNTLTLNGIISGSNGINFTGNGVKRLEGANTYTGTTNVTGGAVVAVDDAAFGTGDLVLGTTLLTNINDRTINNSITANANTSILAAFETTFTIDGTISGSSQITFNGAGTAILTQANPHSGTMRINAGVVGATNDLGFGTSTIFLNGGALGGPNNNTLNNSITVQADSFINPFDMQTLTLTGVISGSNSLTFNGLGTTVLNQANTYTGATTLSQGTTAAANNAAFGTNNISLNGGNLANVGNITLSNTLSLDMPSEINPAASTTFTLDGIISGTSNVNFNGTGTTVLNQANTYAGTTTLSNGVVIPRNDTSFGTGTIFLNGGNFNVDGADRTFANPISIDTNSTINTNGATTLTLNGVISGASDVDFTGGGTLALTATNTYAGNTSLGNVSVSINNTNSPFGTGTVTINGADITAFNSVIDNDIALDSIAVIEVLDIAGTLALNGIISGSNALTLQGPGTTTVSGSNTYSGATTIDGGSVVIANDNAFGVGNVSLNTTVLTNSGNRAINNTIFLNTANTITADTGTTFTFDGAISGANTLNLNGDGTTVLNAFNTHAGPTTVSSGTAIAGNDGAFGSGNVSLNGGNLANNKDVNIPNTVSLDSPAEINPATSTTLTLSGVISGANPVNFNGPGTTVLNQANTFTGATTLSQGTTTAGNDASFGTNNISLNGGNLANVGNITLSNTVSLDTPSEINPEASTTLTLDGIISGSSNVNFNGTGTTVLNQANTYTGATALSQGTTVVGDNASFGISSVSLNGGILTNNANRTITNPIFVDAPSVITTVASTTLTLDGIISGSNTVHFDGPGTTVLNQANTYTGPTTISTGTVFVDNDTAFGTSAVTLNGATLTNNLIDRTLNNNFSVTSASTIIPDVATTLTLNGTISGSGDITVASGGNLVLTGANTSSGTILLQNDDCSIDNNNGFGTSTVTFDGASLTVSNPVNLNNPMVLNQDTTINPISDDLSLNGNITGSGMLRVSGTPGVRENLTLSGTNAYSGGTSLTDLTSTISQETSLGTGPLSVNSSTLNVDGTFTSIRNINVNTTTATEKSSFVVSANNIFTLMGTLAGSDGFIKSGAGELLIPGDQSGIAGTISVTEGTFTIDGLLSNANLEATGVSIITGSGSAGDTLVTDALLKGNGTYASITMNSGTIAPGNSIGTITVTGNYIQNAGAVYELELDSTTSDQIIITGNATIETGAILTILEPLGTILEGTSYDILIASNIDQLWSIVNIPDSVEVSLLLVENDTIARLTVLTSSSFINESVENGNAQNTANYINAIEITKNADLQNIVMSIESDPNNISDSLNQLHHGRFGAFELINVESNYGIISTIDRHQASFQCAKNCAEKPNSVWVGVLGSTASRKQRKELRGSDNTDIGGILGYDYCFGNNVVLGISGGYLHTDLDWDKRGGNATSQKGFATVYGTYNNQRLQTMVCFMGGANFYDIHRRIAFADVDRTANSTNTGGFFSSNFGAKVDLLGTSNTIIAQGNIGYHYLYEGSFQETGANALNLMIDSRTSHLLRSQLGLQISGTAVTQEECIRYYVGGNWVNKSLLNSDNFSAKFLSFQNDSPVLTIRSNEETINGFLAEAGFEVSINSRQISLTYQGEFDNKDQNHQVQASFAFLF